METLFDSDRAEYEHTKTFDANERKSKMIEMRENGFTYQEIGEAFNISKQRVYSIIGGQLKNYHKTITVEQCVYPNLRKWMNDNCITRTEMCRRLYGNSHPVLVQTVVNFLKGKTNNIRKSMIDKYLSVTGLTYEELFERRSDNEQR